MVIFDPSAVRTWETVTPPGTTGAARSGAARSGAALTAGAASRAHPAARINPTASRAVPTPRADQRIFTASSCRFRIGHDPDLRKLIRKPGSRKAGGPP